MQFLKDGVQTVDLKFQVSSCLLWAVAAKQSSDIPFPGSKALKQMFALKQLFKILEL